MSSEIHHPDHYQHGSLETIQVIEEMGIGPEFCRGNAIKYLMRSEGKGGVQDLRKAAWYVHRMIQQESPESATEMILHLLADKFPDVPTAVIVAQLYSWENPPEAAS